MDQTNVLLGQFEWIRRFLSLRDLATLAQVSRSLRARCSAALTRHHYAMILETLGVPKVLARQKKRKTRSKEKVVPPLQRDPSVHRFLEQRSDETWFLTGLRTNRGTLFVALEDDSKCSERQGIVTVAEPNASNELDAWLGGEAYSHEPVIIGSITLVDENSFTEAFGGRVLDQDAVAGAQMAETLTWDLTDDGLFNDPRDGDKELSAAGLKIETNLGTFWLLAYNFHNGYYSHEVYIRAGQFTEYSVEL